MKCSNYCENSAVCPNVLLILPRLSFMHPFELLSLDFYCPGQKIKILRDWEYDSLALEIATDEGMPNSVYSNFDEVHAALISLNAPIDV